MKKDVIILNWNRTELTYNFISRYLLEEKGINKIILVDNGSSSITLFKKKLNTDKILKIFLPVNLGVAGGRNVGILNSEADILIFLDNDLIINQKDIFDKIEENFARLLDAGIITFKLLNVKGQMYWWPFSYPESEYKDKEFVAHVFSGGACAIKRVVFEEIGLFDSYLYYGNEELDLGIRMIKIKRKIYYCPYIELIHNQENMPFSFKNWKGFYFIYRNYIYIFWKKFTLCTAFNLTILRTITVFLNIFSTPRKVSYLLVFLYSLLLIPKYIVLGLINRERLSSEEQKKYFNLNRQWTVSRLIRGVIENVRKFKG